jgi:hypothetical protein
MSEKVLIFLGSSRIRSSFVMASRAILRTWRNRTNFFELLMEKPPKIPKAFFHLIIEKNKICGNPNHQLSLGKIIEKKQDLQK